MNITELDQLKAERVDIVTNGRAMLNRAESRNRELNKKDRARFDAGVKRFREISEILRREDPTLQDGAKGGATKRDDAFGGVRLRTTQQVMVFLGYTRPDAFLRAAKSAGIPFIRINEKRLAWREDDVLRWVASRTEGNKLP